MPEDVNYPFSQIPIPERQSKPRSKGLTVMIDWGLPLGLQRDCIETQGLYVDEAKIAAGIPRVMPAELLKKKIEWDEIYFTEIARRGMGGDTSHPEGAYRLAGIETTED